MSWRAPHDQIADNLASARPDAKAMSAEAGRDKQARGVSSLIHNGYKVGSGVYHAGSGMADTGCAARRKTFNESLGDLRDQFWISLRIEYTTAFER